MLNRMVDNVFNSLDIHKGVWLEDIKNVNNSSVSLLVCLEEELKRDL